MIASLSSQKTKLRQKILSKRNGLSLTDVSKLSSIICKKVLGIKKVKNSQKILVYLPIKNEVDIRFLNRYLLRAEKQLYIFAISDEKWQVSALKNLDDLRKNRFHILQPKKIVPEVISELEVAIVPGVAFNKSGDRLGFGLGVYDKLLGDFKGIKIGLAFDFQITDQLPTESHDLKMNLIVTERRILNFTTI